MAEPTLDLAASDFDQAWTEYRDQREYLIRTGWKGGREPDLREVALHFWQLGSNRTLERTAELERALRESVKFQSHYAALLNQYDGGHRMTFTMESWLERLALLARPAAQEEGSERG